MIRVNTNNVRMKLSPALKSCLSTIVLGFLFIAAVPASRAGEQVTLPVGVRQGELDFDGILDEPFWMTTASIGRRGR